MSASGAVWALPSASRCLPSHIGSSSRRFLMRRSPCSPATILLAASWITIGLADAAYSSNCEASDAALHCAGCFSGVVGGTDEHREISGVVRGRSAQTTRPCTNVPEPGSGSIEARRPIPELGAIRSIRFDGKSIYHSRLTLKATQRPRGNFSDHVNPTRC